MNIQVELNELSTITESLGRWSEQLMMIGPSEAENILKLENLINKLDEQALLKMGFKL